MEYFWIGIGSGMGGMGRYWLSLVITERFGPEFPLGTLMVNVAGSFLIGAVAALSTSGGRLLAHPTAQQFLVVGFLGGFTTFSAFSVQTFELFQIGQWKPAGLNIVLSMTLCLVSVWIGFIGGQWLAE